MPWFDTPETHPQGKWGLHWTMELNNPGKSKNSFSILQFVSLDQQLPMIDFSFEIACSAVHAATEIFDFLKII